MLSLVRSQRACLERLRSAIRWGRGLILLVGEPEQGKTSVVNALIMKSPYLPLQLDGGSIVDRRDVVLRLVASAGLQPVGSDLNLLARLQAKQFSGVDKGIPEIIVDQADSLPPDALQLFHELAFGAYGRRWSILAIGQPTLVQTVLAISRIGLLPSIISLPVWDMHDLRQVADLSYSGCEVDERVHTLLDRYSTCPGHLLQSLSRNEDYRDSDSEDLGDEGEKKKQHLSPRFLISGLIGLATLLAFLLLFKLERDMPREQKTHVIPIQLKS